MASASEEGFVSKSLFLLSGMLIWAAHFGLIYGFNAVVCARGLAGRTIVGLGIVPLGVGLATLVAGTLTLVVLAAAVAGRGPGLSDGDPPVAQFLRYATAMLALLSLVAIIWDGLPALIVPPCG